ncbi:MAG: DedA family protein [Casimicrobium sp.]
MFSEVSSDFLSTPNLVLLIAGYIDTVFPVGYVFNGLALFATCSALFAASKVSGLDIFGFVFVGVYAGDVTNYFLGRLLGPKIITRWPFSKRPNLLPRGRTFLDRYGVYSLVAGRFIAPLRPVVPLLCGAASIPLHKFLVASAISCVLWVAFWTVVLVTTIGSVRSL